MFLEALQYPFFQRALIAGILASIASGVIGSYVVVKRMSSFSGGLSHAVFGGIGFGHYLNFDPTAGALGFGVICSVIMGFVYRWGEKAMDVLISIIWSLGMALGVIFISLTPGYAPDLNSYLFGSILFVPYKYILFVAGLDIAIVLTVYLLYKEFCAISFDEEFSEVVGVPVLGIFLLLLLLVTFAVITLIRVVGIILTIALLTLPAVIAKQWSRSLGMMMVLASVIAALTTSSGLFMSYWFSDTLNLNVPSGPVVIIVLCVLYALSSIVRKLYRV